MDTQRINQHDALQKFIGKPTAEVKSEVQKAFPGYMIADYVWPTFVTADVRMDRIRMFSENGKVIKIYVG